MDFMTSMLTDHDQGLISYEQSKIFHDQPPGRQTALVI